MPDAKVVGFSFALPLPFFITVAIYHCIFEWCFWLEVSHEILGFHCIASWNKHCVAIKITALKIYLLVHNQI